MLFIRKKNIYISDVPIVKIVSFFQAVDTMKCNKFLKKKNTKTNALILSSNRQNKKY